MFSCVLSCEDETALSIIDPTTALVELNNARRQKGRKNAGLLDIAEEQLPSLEVTKPLRSSPGELQGHHGNFHSKFSPIFDIVMQRFDGFIYLYRPIRNRGVDSYHGNHLTTSRLKLAVIEQI